MNNQAIIEKQPLDYIKIFFRRKWLIVLPTVIGICLGVVAANVIPKRYEASTLILVEEGRIENPLIQGLASTTGISQRLGILREQMLGWDRLLQLIEKLDLAKNVKNQFEFEELVKFLRKNIRVTSLNKTENVIRISYEGKDPTQTKKIVQTITDIFIAENLRQQTQEADNAVAFINDQLVLYQKKLKQSEVATMEEQLNKLLVDSTKKHPMVVELKSKIDAAKLEIAEGNYDIKDPDLAVSSKEMADLKEELKQMKEEIAGPAAAQDDGANRVRMATTSNDKLYKLLLLDKISTVEARDVTVTQKLYNTLLERLETAKITQRLESSKEGTKYTILDPPRQPLKPAKPNKVLVMLMGMFLGTCVGGGVIFAAELFDHSFISVEDVKAFFELPVLGAISKIVTSDDLKAQKLRNARITVASIVTGVVLVIVIIFNVIMGN
ncbi:MAG: Wzz/FepE/Etk N-terminal domain-containing protein [Candidatus Omnitrophica bacterium]|nr:Wzz/FepE/Etk N-terminal domain-containing protein [Candidatus Omnitrophota bacterium]